MKHFLNLDFTLTNINIKTKFLFQKNDITFKIVKITVVRTSTIYFFVVFAYTFSSRNIGNTIFHMLKT